MLRTERGLKVLASVAVAMSGVALAVNPSSAHSSPPPTLETSVSAAARSLGVGADSVPLSHPMSPRVNGSGSGALSYLNAVSCVSSTFCVAVGYSTVAGGSARTLVELQRGKHWSLVGSPNPPTSNYSQLLAVSCATSTYCVAVGRSSDRRTGHVRTLVETWSGASWTIVPSVNTSSLADNVLDGVSCARTGSCTAVGYAADTTLKVWHTIVESSNGGAWTRVPSPNASERENNYLLAVSCTSSVHCIAVGYHYKNLLGTLVESWNGRRWTVETSPNALPTGHNILYAVSCATNEYCAAVGTWYVPTEGTPTNRNLIETSSGGRWVLAGSPDTSATERNTLNSVSCGGIRACVAVGAYLNQRNGYNQTLALTQGRSGWSLVDSPNARAPSRAEDNWLNGVSCVTTERCVAVGYSTTPKAISQTLIEAWNGHRWTIVASANR